MQLNLPLRIIGIGRYLPPCIVSSAELETRYALPPGATVQGPAVFEEDESTFICGPNSTARVLADGSISAEAN